MRHLGIALYAEGPTDYYFLKPLLQRLCEDICARYATDLVEVTEPLPLDDLDPVKGAARDVRILTAAKDAFGAWDVVFIHTDGGSDKFSARHNLVDPAMKMLAREFGKNSNTVAVIPVKETEAWALVDGDAIRHALGSNISNERLVACLVSPIIYF